MSLFSTATTPSSCLPTTLWSRRFDYDYCYWSCTSEGPDYADQSIIFEDLGVSMLDSAWQGFNTSLLAYGQTGSVSRL